MYLKLSGTGPWGPRSNSSQGAVFGWAFSARHRRHRFFAPLIGTRHSFRNEGGYHSDHDDTQCIVDRYNASFRVGRTIRRKGATERSVFRAVHPHLPVDHHPSQDRSPASLPRSIDSLKPLPPWRGSEASKAARLSFSRSSCKRRSKNRPYYAARAACYGGVKVDHRRIQVS
jgi:hypothetical protein